MAAGLITHYLNSVVDWEVGLYQRQMENVSEPDLQVETEAVITQQGFQGYLQARFPDRKDIRVTKFIPLSGGFSKTTILVETYDKHSGQQDLVIRAERSKAVIELYSERVVDEFPIVRLAWEAGLTVPEPLWVESDKSLLGTCFIVSRKAPGRNVGSSIGATENVTSGMIASLAMEVAKIHRLDLSRYTDQMAGTLLEKQWHSASDMAKAALDVVSYWRWMGEKAGIAPSTVLERGLRWLEDNVMPCDQKPVLLHGDYGLHNVMIDDDRVTAVLDWEVSHIGDPAEEISWLLCSAGDQLDEEAFLKLYYQAGGPLISEYRLRYFDVFQCVKMSIAPLAALKMLDRRIDNPQLPVFGLRYIYAHTSRLTQAIKRAEEAKQRLIKTQNHQTNTG
ncbi:MAG: phosphotransferase family protein [Tissierellales bacterium]